MKLRIGHGYDFHRFAPKRPMMLGGVHIPHDFGLEGHSDADVLLHAVCDAVLGALALGDIGKFFPNTDSAYKDIDSRKLLQEVMRKAHSQNFKAVNVDVSVIADHPKLAPHIDKMRQCIAADMQLSVECVGVKATTKEGCAPEGIEAHAVVLLEGR